MRVLSLLCAVLLCALSGCSYRVPPRRTGEPADTAATANGGLSPESALAPFRLKLRALETRSLRMVSEQTTRDLIDKVYAMSMHSAGIIIDNAGKSLSVDANGLLSLLEQRERLGNAVRARGERRVLELAEVSNVATRMKTVVRSSEDPAGEQIRGPSELRNLVEAKTSLLPEEDMQVLRLKLAYAELLMESCSPGCAEESLGVLDTSDPVLVAEKASTILTGRFIASLSDLSIAQSVAAADKLESELHGIRSYLSIEDQKRMDAAAAKFWAPVIRAMAQRVLAIITHSPVMAELESLLNRMDSLTSTTWARELKKFVVNDPTTTPGLNKPFGEVLRLVIGAQSKSNLGHT